MINQPYVSQDNWRIILGEIKRYTLLVSSSAKGSACGDIHRGNYYRFSSYGCVIASARFLNSRVFPSAMVSTFVVSTRSCRVLTGKRTINRKLIGLFTVKDNRSSLIVVAFNFRDQSATICQFTLRRRSNGTSRKMIIRSARFVNNVISRVVRVCFYRSFLLYPSWGTFAGRAFRGFKRCNGGVCSRR